MNESGFEKELPEDPKQAKFAYRNMYHEWNRAKAELTRLQDEVAFLKEAMNCFPNPTFIKDDDATFYYANDAYGKLFNIDSRMLVGMSSLDIDYQDDVRRMEDQVKDVDIIKLQDSFSEERSYELSDGEEHECLYWVTGFMEPDSGKRGLVGEIVDISDQYRMREQIRETSDALRRQNLDLEEQRARVEEANNRLKKLNRKIEEASRIDPGTGLYNRYVFDDMTKDLIEEAQTKDKELCALMADLDHFKRVNDTFGHLEGDRVLKDFAKLIKSCTRAGDVAIRYGGEEFLVFLKNTSLKMGKRVAERIRSTTEKELLLPNGEPMTVSIGLVQYSKEENRTECISRVDDALYMAKNTGRNKVVIFSEERESIEV